MCFRADRSGQALIVLILVLSVMMLLIASAMLAASYTELIGSYSDRNRRLALEAAMAGLADARIRLARTPDMSGSCNTPTVCTTVLDLDEAGEVDKRKATYTITVGSVTSPCAGAALVESLGEYDSTNGIGKRKLRVVLAVDSVGTVTQACFNEIQP